MLTWPATVVKDFLVFAASFFQGVSEDGKAVKSSLFIDSPCHLSNCAALPGKPSHVDGN